MSLFRLRCAACRSPGPVLCLACRRQLDPPPTTRVRDVGAVPALFAYAGTGARVVQALKYGDARRLVTVLADDLVELTHGGGVASVEAVSWLPTSTHRRGSRGFDQAELLARAVARRLDLPCRPVLRRRPGTAQTGKDRAARASNVAFGSVRSPVPRSTLVVDDVCTTGATIRAAVEALGPDAHRCHFVVVARTP